MNENIETLKSCVIFDEIRMTKREQEEMLEKLRLQKREYEHVHKAFLSDEKSRYLF